jgi:hypothetical protein
VEVMIYSAALAVAFIPRDQQSGDACDMMLRVFLALETSRINWG